MSARENERRHDHPIPELHLHDIIARISVNRETGIDIEAATVQPQPPVVIPRMPVRVKRPTKETR